MQSNHDPDFRSETRPEALQRPDLDLVPDADSFELVLDRVVDAEESSDEWTAFVEHADRRPQLWRELACQQRDARRLMRAVGARVAPALAALPRTPHRMSDDSHPAPTSRLASSRLAWTRHLGWAAAAAIALAWGVTATVTPARPGEQRPGIAHLGGHYGDGSGRSAGNGSAVHPAALVSAGAPSGAYLEAYIDLGQREGVVVGELPTKYLIESRELGAGAGFEVLFVRPIVERRVVPAMYGFEGTDELGEPRIVPVGGGGVL